MAVLMAAVLVGAGADMAQATDVSWCAMTSRRSAAGRTDLLVTTVMLDD